MREETKNGSEGVTPILNVSNFAASEDPDSHRLRFGSDSNGPVELDEVKRFWDAVQFSNRG